jgi:outer membrane protein
MYRTILVTLVVAALAMPASAQIPQTTSAALRLTIDEAVRLALQNNPDLKADRFDPQIGDTRVAGANGAFKPSLNTGVQRNNQLQPPAGFLIPTPTRNDVVTSNAGLSQRLPWFGTSYNLSWTATHTDSNSFLNSYNPLLQSGLGVSVSQPLLRDLSIDAARQQLVTSRVNRDIADTRLSESVVHTTANVKTAYWNLLAAKANVDARQKALDLAQELARVNKAKVNVGQSPPLDLVSAQAEVASNEEQLIVAETAVQQAEDRLRTLILDTSQAGAWTTTLEPTDRPPVGVTPDLEAAVRTALSERADLVRGRKDIENAATTVKFTGNQRLPDVRLNANYQASGLGGTRVLRSGGFPGTIIGSGDITDFGSVLNQLFAGDYPTWAFGVSVSYPIGQSAEEANHARARLESAQAQERLRSSEARAVVQVRDAWRKIGMNAKRIETTRAARALAEQRLDAEQKRFDVGLSTNFLVIQAQRDLADAKTNELSALLSYALSLVDFEALQQAGPAASEGAAGSSSTSAAASTSTTAAPTPALAAPTGSRPATGGIATGGASIISGQP